MSFGLGLGLGLPLAGTRWSPLVGAALDLDFALGRAFGAAFSDLSVTRASSGMAQTVGGLWVDFPANTLRMTDMGLLVEETRTTLVRSDLSGMIPGSPGTMPTNWNTSGSAHTREILGVQVINGIRCLIMRLAGTAGGEIGINVMAGSTLDVGPGDYAFTFFMSLLSGDQPVSVRRYLKARDAGNVDIAAMPALGSPSPDLTSSLTRYPGVLTAPATTTKLNGYVAILPKITGQPFDIIVALGIPQIELGSFPSSPILGTGTSTTRAADSIIMASIPWYNQPAGTIYVEGEGYDTIANIQCLVSFDDGTTTERHQVRRVPAGTLSSVTLDGNVVQAAQGVLTATMPIGVRAKNAYAYALNDFQLVSAGIVGTFDASGTMPTVTRMQIGNGIGTGAFNGYIPRVAYFGSRLTQAQLQALTA